MVHVARSSEALSVAGPSVPSRFPHAQTYISLAVMIVAWGSNYPLMKLAIGDMPPLAFTALRLAGAAGVLACILLQQRGRLLPARGERAQLAVVGLLQIAAMLGFTIIGLTTVPPGRAALLVYTMQLWAVPFGIWLLRERPSLGMLIGSAIGFAGLLVFFNPASLDWRDRGTLTGSGLILLGAISWSLGSCLYRRHTWQSSLMTQTLWQMGISMVPIAAFSAVFEHQAAFHLTAQLAAIILFNWFVPTALAMSCWGKVLSMMPVSVAGQWLLLTPMVGFALSARFMHEAVTPALLLSAALIVAGIFVTMRSTATGSASIPEDSAVASAATLEGTRRGNNLPFNEQ
jgi:drug/metabolite transporter (DMT)-like permease